MKKKFQDVKTNSLISTSLIELCASTLVMPLRPNIKI